MVREWIYKYIYIYIYMEMDRRGKGVWLVLDSKTPGHERLRVSADGRPSTVGFLLLLWILMAFLFSIFFSLFLSLKMYGHRLIAVKHLYVSLVKGQKYIYYI